VPGRRKKYRVGEFVSALHVLGVGHGASDSSIIRMCNSGEIDHERTPGGQRRIYARELKRVAAILRERDT